MKARRSTAGLNTPPTSVQNDLARSSLSGFVLWCVPVCVGAGAAVLRLRPDLLALTWAGSFAWMSAGCFINARRCHRLHCYISAPAFGLGAIAAASLGFGLLSFGTHALSDVVSITFAAALLSFVPERVRGKYL